MEGQCWFVEARFRAGLNHTKLYCTTSQLYGTQTRNDRNFRIISIIVVSSVRAGKVYKSKRVQQKGTTSYY